jgi:callose synthase
VDDVLPEVVRRLTFFVNSLFMDMPDVPSTRFVKEFTCVTPYYSEDVILSKSDLFKVEKDGVSTIFYLKTLFPREWAFLLERLQIRDSEEDKLWQGENLQEVRLWASRRGQTLSRTVEGMMYEQKALELICELENLPGDQSTVIPILKFQYVVACQVYGSMRQNMESKASDIEYLLFKYPNLRVAYIDCVRRADDLEFYSVLIKADLEALGNDTSWRRGDRPLPVEEVFRIRLAGNPVIGEGKPENQNHALVFTRGRYLQAIDMNQDGYFEDALKMRNILEEFNKGYSILGLREFIFTGSVSNVANYMALQELSFVTLGQRVLANPLHIRQHYGHPDLFDKIFVMTEGGMSKATKGLNLSEDVFAGFNATIRGKTVGFKEYVQFGKGRDVGLQQTYKFEAKLSQGNAEQCVIRDISRICDRLDFFRLMSFYHGGIGHYIAATMVMFTLVVVVYCDLGVAIFHDEGVNGRSIVPEGGLQMALAGLGILQTFPLAMTLVVENDGYVTALSELGFMILSGGPLYYIFQIQTKCHYFSRSLMCGGAMYRPTGRGFVTEHSTFDNNYRYFATSHIYIGVELAAALLLYAHYTKSAQYSGLTWSLWMATASFLLGPFWFNPMTFEWAHIKSDYRKWLVWMAEQNGTADQSWHHWWLEDNECFHKLSLGWKVFLFFQKSGLWIFIGVGLLGRGFWTSTFEQANLAFIVGGMVAYLVVDYINEQLRGSLYTGRFVRGIFLLIPGLLVAFVLYRFFSYPEYFLQLVALYYFASALAFICLMAGFTEFIAPFYKIHDYLVGNVIFLVLGVLTFAQVIKTQYLILLRLWFMMILNLVGDFPYMGCLSQRLLSRN